MGHKITSLLKGILIVALVAVVSACARTPNSGVGNLGPGQAAPGTQQEFLVSVGDRVFFTTDSSILTDEAKVTLDKQAVWLGRYPNYRVLIEGHADERGTREYNIALSARRGSAVVNYLVSRGVNSSRVTTKAFGKERPVAVCNDISCWSQNRRAVTVLVP
ncbi:peptidoglycan-associated lipoprotein Pal [uncultured Maritalea sp.]|uniref:peptidoglycan-associated lipoprotein Pal n=1 Tax=uncultured Maritalea sp. TaxID=757249 RepID=UPI00260F936B|nr:peptidoglycan-associated lipoprotein Pal [uncultured Maritalea sp.]